MAKTDPRIDAYIERAAIFAKPILTNFRALVHKACPEVEETIKWGFPHFDHKGIMCGIAAFKEHCAIGFWKSSLMRDAEKLKAGNEGAMGNLGRITSLKDLPPDKILLGYIKEAAMLNEEEIKLPPRKKPVEKKELIIPDELLKALAKNKKAKTIFENFSPGKKKEYAEWITEAKTEKTKIERITTAVEWIAEGKIRNWKYLKR
jgi:uncharacterized protein YdeI (YjbR/CyaY-like superfamily)